MLQRFREDNTPHSQAPLLGRLGKLETRLAYNAGEIKAAQKLRYTVFCEEMSARSKFTARLSRQEKDHHDSSCDHLLVIDTEAENTSEIVGTQRFFLKQGVRNKGSFYSQQEFDVEALVQRKPELVFMELGRSCILPEYRSKRTMELMWQGTWAYAVENRVDVMLGCASFHAEEASEIATALGFLSKHAAVTDDWQVEASKAGAIAMRPYEQYAEDARSAMRKLPPLIKGYLRLGAMFSSWAVPDPEFGTIDALVVLPVNNINPRYVNYYGEDASKHRA